MRDLDWRGISYFLFCVWRHFEGILYGSCELGRGALGFVHSLRILFVEIESIEKFFWRMEKIFAEREIKSIKSPYWMKASVKRKEVKAKNYDPVRFITHVVSSSHDLKPINSSKEACTPLWLQVSILAQSIYLQSFAFSQRNFKFLKCLYAILESLSANKRFYCDFHRWKFDHVSFLGYRTEYVLCNFELRTGDFAPLGRERGSNECKHGRGNERAWGGRMDETSVGAWTK